MSSINVLPSIKVSCTVAGTDFTDHFMSASMSYSSVDVIGIGVSYITGTIQLCQPIGQVIDYDPRTSQDFLPGAVVILADSSTGVPLPICGYSTIINSNYDFGSSLTIDVGCLLSANNSKAAEDTGLCIDFGALEPVGDVIITLLETAGVPSNSINKNFLNPLNKFFIAEPLLIGGSQSLIQAAGALATQYGYIIYQNQQGIVVVENLLANSNYAIKSSQIEAINYTVVSQPEQAVKQLNLTYGSTEVLNILGATSAAVSANNIIIETLFEKDDDTRTTVSTVTESRDLGNGQTVITNQSIETSSFETSSPVVRNAQLKPLSTCYPEDQARILSKETIITSDNTEVLASWLAYKANANVPSGFTPNATVTSSRTLQEYAYSENAISITKTTFNPIAKIIPVIGDLQLKSSNTAITDIDPETLIPAETIIEIYTRSFNNSNVWRLSRSTYLNGSLVDLSSVIERAQQAGTNLDTLVVDSQELILTNQETFYNQSQPSVETYQTNTEVSTQDSTIFLGSQLNPGITENIRIGNYFEPDESFLQSIGKRHFEYENGRLFSCQAAVPLIDLNSTNIFPLEKAKIVEKTGVAYAYYIDSPAITVSAEEVVISFTGIPFGTTGDLDSFNFFSDNLTPLPNIPAAITTQLYTFDDIALSMTQTLEIT